MSFGLAETWNTGGLSCFLSLFELNLSLAKKRIILVLIKCDDFLCGGLYLTRCLCWVGLSKSDAGGVSE